MYIVRALVSDIMHSDTEEHKGEEDDSEGNDKTTISTSPKPVNGEKQHGDSNNDNTERPSPTPKKLEERVVFGTVCFGQFRE